MKGVVITVTVSNEIDVERYNTALRALCAYAGQENEIVLSCNGAVISRKFSINTYAVTHGLFDFLEKQRVIGTIVEYAVRTAS